MELIDQHTKKIMEGCKERARAAGLRFQDETLEYIVTNRDLLELTPKFMIPTLYDYWVHEVEVLKQKGRYELYPSNPYETVINTRPAVSFFNDNNPDWLNVMIFYHVLAHIDFFQNNIYFSHTWDYDFSGQALSDKRIIARLRSEKGRWLDYAIEFTRGIDNLVSYHRTLRRHDRAIPPGPPTRLDYYFDVFLQTVDPIQTNEYIKEIERYNQCLKADPSDGEAVFFREVVKKHPEFETLFDKHLKHKAVPREDLIQFLTANSPFLNQEKNEWIKTVMQIVRKTSLFFQPQIRTKIMNEGWASYWHETLFLKDERIGGHEVDFAKVHAAVTSLPRVGLNPYALGMRLFKHIEKMADRGCYSFDFQRVKDREARKTFDRAGGGGKRFIFDVHRHFCDAMFAATFLDQDFMDRYNLFVTGRRLNRAKMVWEYYIKSRKLEEYQKMVKNTLYHPPHITIDTKATEKGALYLVHHFEGKPLIHDFIANTMLGIEYLWGGPVKLETSEVKSRPDDAAALPPPVALTGAAQKPGDIVWQRVLYTMHNRKLARKEL